MRIIGGHIGEVIRSLAAYMHIIISGAYHPGMKNGRGGGGSGKSVASIVGGDSNNAYHHGGLRATHGGAQKHKTRARERAHIKTATLEKRSSTHKRRARA